MLDLRRPQMQSNLRLRHNVVKLIRRYLEDEHEFVEVCCLLYTVTLIVYLPEFPPQYILLAIYLLFFTL